MTKNIFLAVAFIISFSLLSKEIPIDKIVAVVNDDIITASDLKNFDRVIKSRKAKMEQDQYSHVVSSEKNMLNQMINDKLVMYYAKENGFASSDDEISEFISSRMRSMGMTQKDLDKQLRDGGQTFEEFRSELKLEKAKADIFERDLKKKIEISESDFETFFRQEFKQDVDIKEYNIKYVVLNNETEASATKNFDKIFKQNNGVDLGFININDLAPELATAARTMNAGDVKGPISSKNAYYMIKVADIKSSKNPEYNKHKEVMERELVQKNFNRLLDDWLNQRREESYVKTYI